MQHYTHYSQQQTLEPKVTDNSIIGSAVSTPVAGSENGGGRSSPSLLPAVSVKGEEKDDDCTLSIRQPPRKRDRGSYKKINLCTILDPKYLNAPIYTSTIDWDQPIEETDFLYRHQLFQLREQKPIEPVQRLAIFDFDNTLFKSPCPNPRLWDQKMIGMLKSTDLGWFQDARTLSSPYLVYTDKHWIRPVEDLVHTEIQRSDTLVALLTGRSHQAYRKTILSLLQTRGNLDFDIVILKETPTRQSPLTTQSEFGGPVPVMESPTPLTFDYKMGVVEDIIAAYPAIQEIAMWDDRIQQCEKTQRYLDALRDRMLGRITKADIYHVPPQITYMNINNEKELVAKMVEEYNHRVQQAASTTNDDKPPVGSLITKKYAASNGVFLDHNSKQRLLKQVHGPRDWTRAGDFMLISPGPANPEYLETLLGAKLGDRVELVADGYGTIYNAVIAVRVSQVKRIGDNSKVDLAASPLYITVAYNQPAGFRETYSGKIASWRPLRSGNIKLQGVIKERMLITASIAQSPPIQTDEVSIGRLVCQCWPELHGREIGVTVNTVRKKMEIMGVENKEENRGAIAGIVNSLLF